MKSNRPLLIILVIISTVLIINNSCSKNSQVLEVDLSLSKTIQRPQGDLIGTWISADLVDILIFTSDHDLFKTLNGLPDHYDYFIKGDSIKIQYSGRQMPYLYIGPASFHFFKLKGDSLTIDCRPAYFGLRPKVVSFNKQ